MKEHIEGFGISVDKMVRGLVCGEIATIMAIFREHREGEHNDKLHWPLAVALVVEYLHKEYDIEDLTVDKFLNTIKKAE